MMIENEDDETPVTPVSSLPGCLTPQPSRFPFHVVSLLSNISQLMNKCCLPSVSFSTNASSPLPTLSPPTRASQIRVKENKQKRNILRPEYQSQTCCLHCLNIPDVT